MEEAIRFLKGSIDDRHMTSTTTIVQQLVHAPAEHEQAVQLLAGCLGDRVGYGAVRLRHREQQQRSLCRMSTQPWTSSGRSPDTLRRNRYLVVFTDHFTRWAEA